jgi:hypothetical protein
MAPYMLLSHSPLSIYGPSALLPTARSLKGPMGKTTPGRRRCSRDYATREDDIYSGANLAAHVCNADGAGNACGG